MTSFPQTENTILSAHGKCVRFGIPFQKNTLTNQGQCVVSNLCFPLASVRILNFIHDPKSHWCHSSNSWVVSTSHDIHQSRKTMNKWQKMKRTYRNRTTTHNIIDTDIFLLPLLLRARFNCRVHTGKCIEVMCRLDNGSVRPTFSRGLILPWTNIQYLKHT